MQLPEFRYHPDPIASGSVETSDVACACCGEKRGWIYAGVPYAKKDLDRVICPWCIADGSAHRKFDASFVEADSLTDLPDEIADTVRLRTPGYASWQQEEWPVCCDDATAFLQPAGLADLRHIDHYEWEGLIMGHIVHEMGISGGAARRLLESLDRDHGPTAYVFRCLHCNRTHFHVDFP